MLLPKKFPKIVVLCGAALSVALVAQGASAYTINNWNYEVYSAFTSWAGTSGGTTGITGSQLASSNSDYAGDPTKLSWPSGGSSQSSIKVDGHVSGVVETNNNTGAPGADFTHTNHVIPSGATSLSDFTLESALTLTDVNNTSRVQHLNMSFDGHFKETPNVSSCGGSGLDGPPPCSDIFVLTSESSEHGLDQDGNMVFQQTFNYDDFDYGVVLTIGGLSVLDPANCQLAGVASGNCIGLITKEDNTNTFSTNLRVYSPPLSLPGPGSLIMLLSGLTLLGLGLVARRRQSGKMAV